MLMTSGDQTPAVGSGRPGTAGTDAGPSQAVMAAWQALGPLMDLVTPMALRVAATLRLADFMPDDGTGKGVVLGDLAERAGAGQVSRSVPRVGTAIQCSSRSCTPGSTWARSEGSVHRRSPVPSRPVASPEPQTRLSRMLSARYERSPWPVGAS
jgi:hypothetical protein